MRATVGVPAGWRVLLDHEMVQSGDKICCTDGAKRSADYIASIWAEFGPNLNYGTAGCYGERFVCFRRAEIQTQEREWLNPWD